MWSCFIHTHALLEILPCPLHNVHIFNQIIQSVSFSDSQYYEAGSGLYVQKPRHKFRCRAVVHSCPSSLLFCEGNRSLHIFFFFLQWSLVCPFTSAHSQWTVYCKPRDTFNFLNSESHHPIQDQYSVVRALLHRPVEFASCTVIHALEDVTVRASHEMEVLTIFHWEHI